MEDLQEAVDHILMEGTVRDAVDLFRSHGIDPPSEVALVRRSMTLLRAAHAERKKGNDNSKRQG